MLLLCCQMLHGEQYLEVLRPINSEGTLEVHCKVVDVLDKGSGTVVLVEGEIKLCSMIIPFVTSVNLVRAVVTCLFFFDLSRLGGI